MIKWLKRISTALVLLITAAALVLWATGNSHILRGLPRTYLRGLARPDIHDMPLHTTRLVPNGTASPWREAPTMAPLSDADRAFLEAFDTECFLVFWGDTIIAEQYWNGCDAQTYLNSFSMAKSFTSIAAGIAKDRGEIISEDEPLGAFIPEYSNGKDADIALHDVLTMTSGIDFGESYSSPFGYMAKAYFGTDLRSLTLQHHYGKPPGTEWRYEGGNTVLLGMAIQSATGDTLSDYFSKHVWSQIGATHPAYWNIDRPGGMEKAFSAFYAVPRDFARIGRLFLNKGRWNGKRILSEDWITRSITPVEAPEPDGNPVLHYGYQWWVGLPGKEPHFFAQGMRGQYIIALPKRDVVIIRFGHRRMEGNTGGENPMVNRLIEVGLAIQETYAQ